MVHMGEVPLYCGVERRVQVCRTVFQGLGSWIQGVGVAAPVASLGPWPWRCSLRHGKTFAMCSTLLFLFFSLIAGPRRSLRLKLSDTRVYEPQIRARLGTTTRFCEIRFEHEH